MSFFQNFIKFNIVLIDNKYKNKSDNRMYNNNYNHISLKEAAIPRGSGCDEQYVSNLNDAVCLARENDDLGFLSTDKIDDAVNDIIYKYVANDTFTIQGRGEDKIYKKVNDDVWTWRNDSEETEHEISAHLVANKLKGIMMTGEKVFYSGDEDHWDITLDKSYNPFN